MPPRKRIQQQDPERVIVINGKIDEDLAGSFIETFLRMDAVEKAPIVVRILSHGGCLEAGFAIFDAIRLARSHVTTEAWGTAGSIAALIFEAGHTRLMAPNATLFIHNGSISGGDGVTGQELQSAADDMERSDRSIHSAMSQRSKRSIEQIAAWCKEETTFSAGEAVSLHLADGVIKG